jgi:hypothetical protein
MTYSDADLLSVAVQDLAIFGSGNPPIPIVLYTCKGSVA